MSISDGVFRNSIIACKKCPRLVDYLLETKNHQRKNGFSKKDYWSKPVPSFGSIYSKILIVGLAPGRHGANRTGRPFTGDYAGKILYRALYETKLSNTEEAKSLNDRLELKNVRITNSVKCAPPNNKPSNSEIQNCRPYLIEEIRMMKNLKFVLALGTVAHKQVVYSIGEKQNHFKFTHCKIHQIPNKKWKLVNSYHPSRYNINTKRLSYNMFLEVIKKLTH